MVPAVVVGFVDKAVALAIRLFAVGLEGLAKRLGGGDVEAAAPLEGKFEVRRLDEGTKVRDRKK